MTRHNYGCRRAHTDDFGPHGLSEAELLHEILERLDRITAAVETGVEIVGPLLKGRLAKLASGRAMAKVQAEWKDDSQ